LGWSVWYHNYAPGSIRDYFWSVRKIKEKGRKAQKKTARPPITGKGIYRDRFRIRKPGEKSFAFCVATRREEVYFGNPEVHDHLAERPSG